MNTYIDETEQSIKENSMKIKAEDYDRMLIEKNLGNEDRRLNLLITQYEELNQQLILNIEIEENARIALDKKAKA